MNSKRVESSLILDFPRENCPNCKSVETGETFGIRNYKYLCTCCGALFNEEDFLLP